LGVHWSSIVAARPVYKSGTARSTAYRFRAVKLGNAPAASDNRDSLVHNQIDEFYVRIWWPKNLKLKCNHKARNKKTFQYTKQAIPSRKSQC